jgi:hypothetical protein
MYLGQRRNAADAEMQRMRWFNGRIYLWIGRTREKATAKAAICSSTRSSP